MAKTSIMPCHDLGRIIRYIRDDKGHTDENVRVLTAATNKCTLFSAEHDMRETIRYWNKEKVIPGYMLLISYGDDELNPDNPEDVKKGLEHAQRLCEKVGGKERQYLIVGQADGVGHKLHFHAVICNVDMETGKCMRGRQTSHDYFLVQKSDEILKDMRIKNRNAEREKSRSEKTVSRTEQKLVENGGYSWMDDFRRRFSEAIQNPEIVDDDSFADVMAVHGIGVRVRGSKKTASGKAISYDFVDEDGKKRTMRASSIGTEYQYENILQIYELHAGMEIIKSEALDEQDDEFEEKTVDLQSQIVRNFDIETGKSEKRKFQAKKVGLPSLAQWMAMNNKQIYDRDEEGNVIYNYGLAFERKKQFQNEYERFCQKYRQSRNPKPATVTVRNGIDIIDEPKEERQYGE